ncbi:hypothetical protein K402DRAFT_144289 [Aulographum hederae CBS 113979]|uniref:Phosphoglucomutase-2 n=1 Tax=Aulographum hederae CBS 113979 TaxID=1176131 RepID=A0A6G1GU22_9PEZI|nr:hypothetical protein K402DRAFT_144289 [Aulographum hederae CBS 113979]
MSSSDDSIEELAKEWLRVDQDEKTRDEIYQLLVQNKRDELKQRLKPRITFGTAGLRARMEAGFARMNAVTVIQATQGLAEYILETNPESKRQGVVIGRDARHNSERFARLAAAVFLTKRIKVWWYELNVHTPLVPFGVKKLNAAAGLMITASHNPAQDNGYKVYWSNGCQIIPPHDTGIAAAIDRNPEPSTWDTSAVDGNLLVEGALGLVKDAYFDAVRLSCRHVTSEPAKASSTSPVRFVYTPMHGVGLPYMSSVVESLKMSENMVVVPEQAEPDPDFPTVKFPNPEEKGALDLAIRTADENGITLILASDPDADRLAVAAKTSESGWHQFTGNQLGILLASHIFDTWQSSSAPKEGKTLAMLASTVSSNMLAAMARAESFQFVETLTGFKWLGNRSIDLIQEGYDVQFAFEEAIGYMVPGVVLDKDSLAAGAAFLTAVGLWQTRGLSPWAKLQELYEKYGYFEDANTYLVSPEPATTDAVFKAIRALGKPYPAKVGSRKVLRWRDLTEGYDSGTDDKIPTLPVSKSSQMITCDLGGEVRFTARGSGTEPKIKLYIECRGKSADEAKRGANEVLQDLLAEWFQPEKYGLKLA